MRLDVADPGTGDPRDPVQRGDLVQHLVAQLAGLVVDPPPAEPGQIAVARPGRRPRHPRRPPRTHAAHRRRVTGVEAARHVRRRHHVRASPSSSPSRQTPNPSPRSAFRSMAPPVTRPSRGPRSRGRHPGRSVRHRRRRPHRGTYPMPGRACARRGRRPTTPITGYPPVVGWSARNTSGLPSGVTCTAPSTMPSLGSSAARPAAGSAAGRPGARRPGCSRGSPVRRRQQRATRRRRTSRRAGRTTRTTSSAG